MRISTPANSIEPRREKAGGKKIIVPRRRGVSYCAVGVDIVSLYNNQSACERPQGVYIREKTQGLIEDRTKLK